MLSDRQMNVSQRCAQVAKQATSVLTWINNSMACRSGEVTVPLYLAWVRLHLESWIWF